MSKKKKKEPSKQQVLDLSAFWGVDPRTIRSWIDKQDKRLTHHESKKIYNPNYPIPL